MEYEFVRFKDIATGEESHKWWFAAKTARQVCSSFNILYVSLAIVQITHTLKLLKDIIVIS